MGNIIDRIIELQNSLGMSVSSFAASIGVNQVTLNNYKLGKRKPSLELVEKVAARYPQVSVNWLIKGEGSMYSAPSSSINSMFDVGDNNQIIGSGDATLLKENEMLKKLLDEKERTIQVLMNKQ